MNVAERNQLVEANLSVADTLAWKMTGLRRDAQHRQDCYQIACVELLASANAYDPTRGAQFSSFAWPRVARAIQRFRVREKREYETLTSFDGFAVGLGDRPFTTGETPEDALIEAEAWAVGLARLERLTPKTRGRVELLLAGHSVPRVASALVVRQAAKEAGVHVLVRRTRMTGAERTRRWFARMSPEKRERLNAAKRARTHNAAEVA